MRRETTKEGWPSLQVVNIGIGQCTIWTKTWQSLELYFLDIVFARTEIDRIHKWRLNNYSFVFMSILTSLVCTNKIQKNFCFKVRLVRMISTETEE